jgi:hypothetical protein
LTQLVKPVQLICLQLELARGALGVLFLAPSLTYYTGTAENLSESHNHILTCCVQ